MWIARDKDGVLNFFKEKQNNYVSYRVDNKTTRLILIAKAKKLKLI